jgi:hypothetical protein
MPSDKDAMGSRSKPEFRSTSLAQLGGKIDRLATRHPFVFPWTVGASLAVGAYVLVFSLTLELGLARTLWTSLINVVTAYLLGLLVRGRLTRAVSRLPTAVQVLTHSALACIYSLLWYVSTISLLGWRDGSLASGASVTPFRGLAFIWQCLQGLALYALAAALAVVAEMRLAPRPSAPPSAPEPAASRLLIRDRDEIRAIELDEIILVAAADDYAEIVTSTARHLARKSLSDFEAELPSSFVRVHRSTLINLDRLVRAEPAGAGRMTLHLSGGQTVVASRAGARLLRERTA